MESMYETVLKYIKKKGMLDKFETRLEAGCRRHIRNRGFHDQLSDLYQQYVDGVFEAIRSFKVGRGCIN